MQVQVGRPLFLRAVRYDDEFLGVPHTYSTVENQKCD